MMPCLSPIAGGNDISQPETVQPTVQNDGESIVTNKAIQKRIFVVGCPRSGTTLLQSLLAAHSQVETFPESHFFEWLFSGRTVPRALGVASRRARGRLYRFIDQLERPELRRRVPWYAVTVRQLAGCFVRILDTLTQETGSTVWLEKTPGHLHHVDDIGRLVDNAQFVHILRGGADVVASLYDVGKRFPELWGGYTVDLDMTIQRWVDDTRASLQYDAVPNHILVRYEDLVADARPIVVDLCERLDLPFEETMLTGYRSVASEIVLSNEPWKEATDRPITSSAGRKFQSVFTEDQQAYILERIEQAQIGDL